MCIRSCLCLTVADRKMLCPKTLSSVRSRVMIAALAEWKSCQARSCINSTVSGSVSGTVQLFSLNDV